MEGDLGFGYCNRCGLCLSVCPTYRDTGLETQSPRGRMALLAADLLLGKSLIPHLYHCLDCRACQTLCPAGVKVGEAVLAARAQWEKAHPQPLRRRLFLRQFLPFPGRLDLIWRLLKVSQRLGLYRLLPGKLGQWGSFVPRLPKSPLSRSLPEVVSPEGPLRYRVGFFLGCAMNLFFPEASRAALAVLSRNGCQVIVPREAKCCGAFHESLGDREALRELARYNIALFQGLGVAAVVTDCAACGATLKGYGELLAKDPEYAEAARVFSSQVLDLSQFLANLPVNGQLRDLGLKVTYHDPCHLIHGQGVSQEPRLLLQSIPGLELVEMEEADWCCGGAGIYCLTHLPASMRILERKMERVAATGAQVVATANPGCLIQLGLGVRRHKLAARVAHWVELLDEAGRAFRPWEEI